MSRKPDKQAVADLRDTIQRYRRSCFELCKAKEVAAKIPKMSRYQKSLGSLLFAIREAKGSLISVKRVGDHPMDWKWIVVYECSRRVSFDALT